MTKRVLKFDVIAGGTTILPIGPWDRVLAVGEQGGLVRLWAEVETDVKGSLRRDFTIIATGDPVAPDMRHIGSVVMRDHGMNGRLVWHVYEIEKVVGE